jgi:hypothetical protein
MRLFIILAVVFLAGCSESQGTPKDPSSKQAWNDCKFELAKIEAIRGRNLDDLNRGIAVARNQFLNDCMATKNQSIPAGGVEDAAAYAAAANVRKPNEIRLNRVAEGSDTSEK